MNQEHSGNPALSNGAMDRVMAVESTDYATVGGTIFKTLILVTLAIISAAFSWRWASNAGNAYMIILFASSIIAFGLALAASFIPKSTPITAPLYAIAEGVLLGAVSMWASQSFGNIVIQAVALTGVIFFSTLFLYQARIVRVTERFKSVVIIATFGIVLYYILTIIFGIEMPLVYDTGAFGILFSLAVIFIAALNLLLDFNFVETAAANKAPKVFEWYGAFGLTVTLIWLYFEILRLISKIRN